MEGGGMGGGGGWQPEVGYSGLPLKYRQQCCVFNKLQKQTQSTG